MEGVGERYNEVPTLSKATRWRPAGCSANEIELAVSSESLKHGPRSQKKMRRSGSMKYCETLVSCVFEERWTFWFFDIPPPQATVIPLKHAHAMKI